MEEEKPKYISLQEATKYCSYSPDYLKLRARQGKLRAIKIARNWVTKKEWLEEYLKKVREYNKVIVPTFAEATAGRSSENLSAEEKLSKSDIDRVKKEIEALKEEIKEIKEKRVQVSELRSFKVKPGPALRFGFILALVFVLATAGGVFGKEGLIQTYQDISSIVKEVGRASNSIIKGTSQNLAAIATQDVLEYTLETFKEYGRWLNKNLKSQISNLKRIPQILTRPWRPVPEVEIPPPISEEEKQRISALETQLQELKEKGIPTKEIIREIEVSKITKVEPVREITRETIRIDDKELAEIKIQLTQFSLWGTDIENLKEISRRLQSQVPPVSPGISYTLAQPVSQNTSAFLASLNVSGSSSFSSDLTVAGTLTIGSSTTTITDTSITTTNLTTTNLTASGTITLGGTSSFTAPVTLTSITTPQLSLRYDSTNKLDISVSSTGQVTLDAIGTGANFTFSDSLTVPTINGLTLTSAADGFTIAGGTTSRTLTITGSNVAINQNLRTTDSPTFAGLTLSGLTTDGVVKVASGVLSSEAQLTIARGGTAGTATPTAGAVAYGTGTAYAFSVAGSANQVLISGGAGAASWSNIVSLLTAGTNISISGTTNATIATIANPSFSTSVTTPLLTNSGALTIQTQATAGADDIIFQLAGAEKMRILENGDLFFEKGTFDTTLAVTTPTAARTITFPDAGGTVAVSATTPITLSAAGAIGLTTPLAVSYGGTGATTLNDLIALTTHTTGNYVASLTAGSGILVGAAGEGATPSIALSSLTADWSQAGAFDIVLANTSSELKILEAGTTPTLYGIFDVADLSTADKTYTFPDLSGTVTVLGNTTTGSGSIVLATSPTLTTPNIGAATATSITIGANTLDTNEWANLDGLNQTLATTSTPQFARMGLGAAADATNILTVTSASTTDLSKALNVSHTGAITGTGYAGYFSKTGASTTNVGLYATASGATNNYAAIFDGGNVGIGTTGPDRKLDVLDTANPQLRISQADGTVYIEFQVAATTGDLTISLSPGDDITIPDDNLWVCTGGACPAGTPTGTGNLLVESNVGIGTSGPVHKLDVSGAMYSRRYTLTYGATTAVDWNNGNVQSVVLTGNTTFTFSNGQDGGKYILIIKQDATGSRTVTWPATVRWPGGTGPTLTTTASKTDYIGFIYNGVDSKYDGVAWRLNY